MGYDALSLYESDAHLIASWCGTSAPPTSYTSDADGYLLITFTTDGSVTRPGFWLAVTFAPVDGSRETPAEDSSTATVAPTSPGSDSDADSTFGSSMMGSDAESGSSPDLGSDSNPSNPNGLPVKIVKWATDDKSLKAKEDKSEAAFKRKMAEITRKGAAESKKLVEFFRAVHQQRPLFTTIAVGAATLAGGTAANALWSWLG